MLNHIDLAGRLTRDPDLRYTQSNVPVASFSVAVERDIKGPDGNRATDFIDCVAWRGTGEFIQKYFRKGDMIILSGRLQMRKWIDRDGNNRTSAEVLVSNVYFGAARKEKPVDTVPQDAVSTGGFEELSDDDGESPF